MDEERMITIVTYPVVAQAEMAKFTLEKHGLRVFIADANIVTNDWFLGNAVGQIKVQVPESQAREAVAIIRQDPRLMGVHSEDDEDDDLPDACLACGAIMEEEDDECAKCGWSYEDVEEAES